ncbi:MAG: hypothetical protein Q8Q50_03485 [Methylobacter sp.]|nr:hypothetical protein [Methylobacter sp.]
MAQTNPTAISALPTAPSTANPASFATLADAFIAALATLRTETNAISTVNYNNAVDAFNNAVAAAASAADAATQFSLATTQANNAAASAFTAVNAPGTSATSTTSLTVGLGSQSLTIQTGKSWVIGQFVVIASTASPANYMTGQITAYDSGTGALAVLVDRSSGAGTLAAWTISLTAPVHDIERTLSIASLKLLG